MVDARPRLFAYAQRPAVGIEAGTPVLAAILATDDYWERLQRGGTLGIVGYGHVGRLLAQRATQSYPQIGQYKLIACSL